MSRVRFFLVCLMTLALPLQGYAAVAMLYCGMGTGHEVPTAQMQTSGGQTHHHHQTANEADAAPAHAHTQAHGIDDTADQAAHQPSDGLKQLPDSTHKCGVCASCCNAAAISDFPLSIEVQLLPQAELVEPFVLISAVPSRLPEKPPRV